MKRKFYIGWLLLSLIFVIGAVGLSSCSNDDDDLKGKVYNGYIERVETGTFTIKVTHSPYKPTEVNESGDPMPQENDFIKVNTIPDTDFNLKEGQKLSFRVFPKEIIGVTLGFINHSIWECEIELIKLY